MVKTIQELLEFGIINIDKSSGPTSFSVSEFVKKKLKLRKTSHFGTLDPKVTGVLPIALNRACKLTGFFLGEDKEYIGIMRLHEDISLDKIKKAIKEKFLGKIIQLPPVKSRVKRQEREREIKSFDLIEKDGKDILFKAEVQGGTYIRKLISDLGDYLKIGAHMLELRRVRAGIFKEDSLVSLYDFEKAVDEYERQKAEPLASSSKSQTKGEEKLRKMIIPAEIVKEVYKEVQIKESVVDKILHGKPIYNSDLKKKVSVEKESIISVFAGERFIGMFKVIKGKDIFAKSEFVLQPLKE